MEPSASCSTAPAVSPPLRHIWDHFKRLDNTSAVCNHCGVVQLKEGGTTSGLHAHLRTHGMTALKRQPNKTPTTGHDQSSTELATTTSGTPLLPIWEYFTRINESSAMCCKCLATLKAEGGTTSGLHAHLRTHGLTALKRKPKNPKSEPETDQSVQDDTESPTELDATTTPVAADVVLYPVWEYFTRIKETATAACHQCGAILKAEGGSTSGLHHHLKVHGLTALKRKPKAPKTEEPIENSAAQLDLTDGLLKIEAEAESDDDDGTLRPVWHYFMRTNDTTAVCRRCRATLKVEGGTTSGLHAHLRVHGLTALKRRSNNSIKPPRPDVHLEHTNLPVGEYFERIDKLSVRCNTCDTVLKTVGGSTSGMHSHLRMRHQIVALKRAAKNEPSSSPLSFEAEPSSASVAVVMTDGEGDPLHSKDDEPTMDSLLQFTIARLVAKDQLSFRVLSTSVDLRSLLKNEFNRAIPLAGVDIRQAVMAYGQDIQRQLKSTLASARNSGSRFSLSLDEWKCQQRNRRYIHVKLHFCGENRSQTMHLGAFRAYADLTSAQCAQKLLEKLDEFGLSLEEDIVCCTTDGGDAMLNMVRELHGQTLHVSCMLRALQLAVGDVLYNNGGRFDGAAVVGSDDESDDEEDCLEIVTEESATSRLCDNRYEQILQKVRKAASTIKRSGVQLSNGVILNSDHGKRWSSLVDMIETFLACHEDVIQLLIDLGQPIQFYAHDLQRLRVLLGTLAPLKAAIEVLDGGQNVLLVSAEVTMNLLLERLRHTNTDLTDRMVEAVSRRFGEQRKGVYIVLKYLHCAAGSDDNSSNHSPYLSSFNRDDILAFVMVLVQRLFPLAIDRNARNDTNGMLNFVSVKCEPSHDEPTVMKDMREQFEDAIAMALKPTAPPQQQQTRSSSLRELIDGEMFIFDRTGSREKYLQLVYDALRTVPYRSVSTRRAFSAEVRACSRLRSRLSDDTIDTILMLRGYFQNMEP